MIQISEDAFYGYLYRTREKNCTRKLYDSICRSLSENSDIIEIITEQKGEVRDFNVDEARVRVSYNSLDQRITIEVMSFIGGAVLSDRERNLVRLVEQISKENKFQLIKSDENKS